MAGRRARWCPIGEPPLQQRCPFSARSDGPGAAAGVAKEELGPLGKHIRDIILATGPISVAKYMQLALTSPIGGYYTRGQAFGREGDFVTSPEISQMFGEIMAVWFRLHWEMLGRPARTALVELGPGRGTLMDDMLRAARRFPEFFASIRGVHLVERSPELRRVQHDRLGCDAQQTKIVADQNAPERSVSVARGGIPIHWYDMLDAVDPDSDCVPLVIAHEFFDALPVHKFEKGTDGLWHELLVDVAESSNNRAVVLRPPGTQPQQQQQPESCHFKLVRTRSVSASAALLLRDKRFDVQFDKGDMVEVSPESARVMAQLADWISRRNGLGLIIDYGQDWTQGDTFRGIKNHRFANPLVSPGSMDLTADVDFSYLRFAARGKAACHGPIEQGAFLHAMGIQARLQQLLQATSDSKTQKDLVDCYRRLTDPLSMGRVYKMLAVLPGSSAVVPVPFAPPTGADLNKPKVEKIVR
ncbi:hypothetical protein LPJ61_005679 [Coemansia biformis]|uniref:Protein arginine methyltransferase NDUFAF7 n=1 Tax=Coemansia biformis TaxID=1286918 RepID=A0A9W8CTI7_9FUNG|nr:hypothetical protein LPJ61_005679 [Coemansia biformis]